jgi:hypothetical protein
MTLFLQHLLNISVAHEVTEKHDAQTLRLSQTLPLLRKHRYRNIRHLPQEQSSQSPNYYRRSYATNGIIAKI